MNIKFLRRICAIAPAVLIASFLLTDQSQADNLKLVCDQILHEDVVKLGDPDGPLYFAGYPHLKQFEFKFIGWIKSPEVLRNDDCIGSVCVMNSNVQVDVANSRGQKSTLGLSRFELPKKYHQFCRMPKTVPEALALKTFQDKIFSKTVQNYQQNLKSGYCTAKFSDTDRHGFYAQGMRLPLIDSKAQIVECDGSHVCRQSMRGIKQAEENRQGEIAKVDGEKLVSDKLLICSPHMAILKVSITSENVNLSGENCLAGKCNFHAIKYDLGDDGSADFIFLEQKENSKTGYALGYFDNSWWVTGGKSTGGACDGPCGW